ncbi:T7SS effector LXG polymorphic toxin [Streptococcus sp. SM3]|uniref:T7SS effector LXG polymorphic toxin n=1 Tax=Streptococcus sp. SM3 TaxID=2898231 RepID=UPI0022B78168|nr:T7SS effector LXG polymorphic toxin [Streptococcus sp. SM3]
MKIKRSELESLKNFLYKQTQAFEDDLAEAQSTAQSLASSQALRGDVKTAINHELNYYNLPLLQGYVDYSNLLYTEFDNLISDFESTVGEKSATAVINSEALTSLKQSVDGLHSSIVRDMDATNKYYTEISDLISLKAPSKDKLSRAIEASKQSLSETEKRLATFNGKQATSELDAILNNQNKGLTKVSGTVTMASPYRNPEALAIYRNPHFKKAANRYHQKVDSLARAYFQKNHPGVAFDKDKAGIEELQALAREVTKKAEYGDSSSVKTLGDYGNDLAETSVYTSLEEGIKHLIEKMKVSVPDVANYWSVGISGNSYYKNMNFAFDAQQFAKDSTTNALKGLFNNITVSEVGIPIPGTNVSMGISGISSVFMGMNFLNNLQNENAGRAFTHTAVTTAVTAVGVDVATTALLATATGSGGLATVATVLASNPVGWTIIAGVAVGYAVDLAYKNNFLGIRDIANDMGDNLDKSIKEIGNSIDSGIKSIQKVFGW